MIIRITSLLFKFYLVHFTVTLNSIYNTSPIKINYNILFFLFFYVCTHILRSIYCLQKVVYIQSCYIHRKEIYVFVGIRLKFHLGFNLVNKDN